MRWLVLTIAICATLATASAQRPWSDYNSAQRARIIASRGVTEEVRTAVSRLGELSVAEREALWAVVSQPVKSSQIASLHLFLYDMLRPADGSASEVDIAMLKSYPQYMLARWSEDLHRYDVYNYAYALANYSVEHGSRGDVNSALRRVGKRRYMRCYGSIVENLVEGLAIAENSIALGRKMECDHTDMEVTCRLPYEISLAEYKAAIAQVNAVDTEGVIGRGDVVGYMAAECASWDGSYNRELSHTLGKGVGVTLVESATAKHIVIDDGVGGCVTLPAVVYILPDGGLFAIDIDGEGRAESVYVGAVEQGRLRSIATVAVYGGVVRGAKCTNEGLYLWIDDDRGAKYYRLSRCDYERY